MEKVLGILVISIVLIGSVASIMIPVIKAHHPKNQHNIEIQKSLKNITLGLLLTSPFCLWLESGLEIFFSHKNHHNNNYLIYSIVVLINFTGYAIFHLFKKYKTHYLKLVFLASSFIVSFATAIYFFPLIWISLIPFFGLLILVPLMLSVIFLLDLIKTSKTVYLPSFNNLTSKITLTILLGILNLLLTQGLLNQFTYDSWQLVKIFED